MTRYRGENSNVEDIAARFDKHLDIPVPQRIPLKEALRRAGWIQKWKENPQQSRLERGNSP